MAVCNVVCSLLLELFSNNFFVCYFATVSEGGCYFNWRALVFQKEWPIDERRVVEFTC